MMMMMMIVVVVVVTMNKETPHIRTMQENSISYFEIFVTK